MLMLMRPLLTPLCLFFVTIPIVTIPIVAIQAAADAPIFTLDQLLERAQVHNTDVAVARWRVDGARAKLKQARDLCVDLGIAMTIEDSWGGDIVTAAISSLAHSTPEELLFTATDFNSYVTISIAKGAPQRQGGRLAASTEPGLGVQPRMDVLGDPVLVLE